MPETKKQTFPDGFLWGSAISSYQTEGGNTNTDWWAWEHSEPRIQALRDIGKNPAAFQSGIASDFYHNFEEDIDIAKKLNHSAFRLSLEWARIEPKPGVIDYREMEYYHRVLSAIKKRKMKVFLTLHHFTLPAWFALKGGFEYQKNVNDFVNFTAKVVKHLGELVDFWITINEPTVYATHSYLFGRWPPNKRKMLLALRVLKNLFSAHEFSSQVIRKHNKRPLGLAYALVDIEPSDFMSTPVSRIVDYFLNDYQLRNTVASCDFLGLNYYMHKHIGWLGKRVHSKSVHTESDLGWGLHPEGIERALLKMKKYGKPIYITENGIADATDTKRTKFIRDHLRFVLKAIKEGTDVKGYMYWSLLDNFEWAEGFEPRFGLVEVDYVDQKRTVRPSAHEYAKIIRDNGL